MPLWERLLDRSLALEVDQDNQATARVMTTGRAPTLRHIKRTRSASIAWLNERVLGPDITLNECISEVMAADIFTKRFTNKEKWEHVCLLIGMCTQDKCQNHSHFPHELLVRPLVVRSSCR